MTQSFRFVYDCWNLIHETVDNQTVTTNIYIWGLDLSGTLQEAGGVGGLLSQTVISDSPAKSYFPLADANGNVTEYVSKYRATNICLTNCLALLSLIDI